MDKEEIKEKLNKIDITKFLLSVNDCDPIDYIKEYKINDDILYIRCNNGSYFNIKIKDIWFFNPEYETLLINTEA